MSTVKLMINLNEGVMDIESDVEFFERVADKAEILLSSFGKNKFEKNTLSENKKAEDVNDDSLETDKSETTSNKPSKRKRSSSSASANWSMVDNLINEEGRNSLKKFYNEKSPSNQNEQVAVLVYKLKELTKRDGFDGNEIYTAYQIVGKKTPRNLNAVFGNMASSGLGSQEDKKFKNSFVADDMVKLDLPRKDKKK